MANNKTLNNLPSIEKCKRIFQSLAILEAIIMPEWEYRYYSFNSKWDTNEMMASMRDGSGEHYFALFNEHGLIIKGFETNTNSGNLIHINQLSEIFKNIPVEFESFLNEPAFVIDNTTFCVWNLNKKSGWNSSKTYETNELYLLVCLLFGAKGYKEWAEEYYEIALDLNLIEYIFKFEPLTPDIIKSLNKDVSIDDIYDDILEIGYPVQEK